MTKNGKNVTAKKKNIFLIKICSLPIPRLHKGRPCYKKSLQALKREHPDDPGRQNMKFLYFSLFLWVIFAHLDPDPHF
jgi:hypothetical protein